MYSLTRLLEGSVLACSCGYPRSLDPANIVLPEWCEALPTDAPTYTVNCVHDLDEDGYVDEGQGATNMTECHSPLPLGCVYEDLVKAESLATLTVVGGEGKDPLSCQSLCAAVVPGAAIVAARWDDQAQAMVCHCLPAGAVNETNVGPQIACDQECKPAGTGLTCGGSGRNRPVALSLYCPHPDEQESTEEINEGEEGELELEGAKELLTRVKAIR